MMLYVSTTDTTVSNNGRMIYQSLHAVSNYLCLWKTYESIYLPQDDRVIDDRVIDASYDVLYLLYKHYTVSLLHDDK
jgi:hypothetical protein